jgi:hypothetical protein
MAVTYEPIATQTITGSSSSGVTFNSFAGYTDIRIIAQVATLPSGGSLAIQVNSDTGSNYSTTRMYGNGSTATSDRVANTTALVSWGASTLNPVLFTVDLMNYANTTTYKTSLTRVANAGEYVAALVGLWRNTAAITSIAINAVSTNFPVGSTFTLYGIKAA